MQLRPLFTLTLAGALLSGADSAARPHDGFTAGTAQSSRNADDPCRQHDYDSDRARECQVREYTLPAGPLHVDAGGNGGIRVEGTDRSDIRVLAVVTTYAETEAEAKELASQVEVQAGGGRVSTSGPQRRERRTGWSVSFRLEVPRQSDLELLARNGGISIRTVEGTIRFETTNGGVRLADLSGDVRGETRNGGVTVDLGGDRWEGSGLHVQTSNGGVTLAIPDSYNAELTTGTVNGSFRSEVALTVQGELSPRRGLSATLGAGGAPVSVRTVNGGLRIQRR